MSKKRKVVSETDAASNASTRNCVAEVNVETTITESIDQSSKFHRNSTISTSDQDLQDTEGRVKKKKRKKDKDGKETTSASENPSTDQDTALNQYSDENSTKKKKRKKDKYKELEHDDEQENDTKPMETNNSLVSAVNEDLDGSNENVKKRKKKKTKGTIQEANADEEAQENEASKAIGTVDTDILKQASVNLGLPLADHETNDAQLQAEQKKAKKKQKKKDKDKPKNSTVNQSEIEGVDLNKGFLSYLRLWHSNRKAWKFNKRLQIKLIHNMYNKEKLSDEDFEVLLLYLDGLQGKSREKTKEEAEKMVTDDTTESDEGKQERARQVFQMLS